MEPFPHRYSASATAGATGDITVESADLPPLATAAPAEFGGPGDRWSPETLLIASVADCFILTFRAVARATRLPYVSLRCEAAGTLDRVDRVTSFTSFDLRAHLVVPAEVEADDARRALLKSEEQCLITSSLRGACRLEIEIEAVEPVGASV
jgi:organic hydroperoxide reductase OsmC/OhrA